MTREAILWNDRLKKWIIFPRKISPVPYTPAGDAKAFGNRMVVATENFTSIESTKICKSAPSKGFSDVSLIKLGPSKGLISGKTVEQDIYFAIKTTEDEQRRFGSFVSIIVCEYPEPNESSLIDGSDGAFFDEYLCEQIYETEIPGDYKFEGILAEMKN